MSSNENFIPFPVEQLKAETLRSIAKDLHVPPGGKKDDLVKRMRTSSASGWTTTTPSKRKAGDVSSERPSTTKKTKTPQSVKTAEASTSASRSSPSPNVPAPTLVEAPDQVKPEDNGNANTKQPPPFDDYFVSGTTSVYITADDLFKLAYEVPTVGTTPLWKSSSAFAQVESKPEERVHHWVIPSCEEDAVQNVSAFREEYKDLFRKERSTRESTIKTEEAEKKVEDEVPKIPEEKGPKDGEEAKGSEVVAKDPEESGIKNTEEDGEPAGEPARISWYELSVSRRLSKGALAVRLTRGGIEGVIRPLDGVGEETGNFWLSKPRVAGQDDATLLNQLVEKLL